MKLNIYKNQKEIEKTYEVEAYDIMLGTAEDFMNIFDEMDKLESDDEVIKLLYKNRSLIYPLLLDVFAEQGITKKELRFIKIKELIPFIVELIEYVKNSFSEDTSKN